MMFVQLVFVFSFTTIVRNNVAREFDSNIRNLSLTTTVRNDVAFGRNNYILNVSRDLCPFTDFCSMSSTEMLTNETVFPCCSDCSCDVSTCYQTENCCPDIEPMPDEVSDLICANTMTKLDILARTSIHNGITDGIKRYYILTSCPKDYKDDLIESKCNGKNQTDIDDFLWVSDLESGTIYQNYFCAMCHEVDNWLTWSLRTNCYTKLMDTGFNNITATLLSDDCNIVNEVPESKREDSRKYQCYIPDFTSCSNSGIKYDTEYIGCFKDTSDRDLVGVLERYHDDNTPQKCINLCIDKGFQYAGVQSGFACLCGNSYGKHGALPETRCRSACTGDDTLFCGGAWSNHIYKIFKTDSLLYEEACHSFTQLFFNYQVNLDAFAIYKNVFCWLCNAETKTEVPALCPDLHGDTLSSPLGSSSALIDLKRMKEANDDSNSGSRQCSAGEKLDKYLGRCRILECPMGSLAVDGVCKQVVSHIINSGGLSLMLIVRLQSNWSAIANTTELMGQLLVEELEKMLALQQCNNCSVRVYVDNLTYSRDNIKIDVLFEKGFTPSCQLDVIHKQIQAISKTEIEIPLTPEVHLSATTTIAEKSDYGNDKYAGRKLIFFRSYFECSQGFNGKNLEITGPFCPSIEIAFSESQDLRYGRKKESYLSFFNNQKHRNENTTVIVCTNDYMTVMRQTSGSAARHILQSGVVFLVFQTLHSFL